MTMNNSFYGRVNTAPPDFIQYDPSKAAKLRALENHDKHSRPGPTVSSEKAIMAQPKIGEDCMATTDVGYVRLTGDEKPGDGGDVSRRGSKTRTADDSADDSIIENGSSEHDHRENEDCSQGSTVVSYNSPHVPDIRESHQRGDKGMTRDRELSHSRQNDDVDAGHTAKSSPTMNIQSLEGANSSIVKTPTLQTTSGMLRTFKRRCSLGEESNIDCARGKRRRKAGTGSLQHVEVDTNCAYEVKKIRAVRITKDGRREYQVDWSRDPRWYGEADLRNCPLKIREFHEQNPERPAPPVELHKWIEGFKADNRE